MFNDRMFLNLFHKSVFACSNVRRTWTNIRTLNKNVQCSVALGPWTKLTSHETWSFQWFKGAKCTAFWTCNEQRRKMYVILNNSFKHKLHGLLEFRIWTWTEDRSRNFYLVSWRHYDRRDKGWSLLQMSNLEPFQSHRKLK